MLFQDIKPQHPPLVDPKTGPGPYPFPSSIRPTKVAPPQRVTPVTSPVQAPPGLQGSTDPRWVLAVRVAESLQGSILPPDKRDRLIRVGKMLGLSAFDANLIVAMIQDQARRGLRAMDCAQAAQPQLCMVPLPVAQSGSRLSLSRIFMVASATVVTEAFLFWWLVHWLIR